MSTPEVNPLECSHPECGRSARMAIRTTRRSRDDLRVTAFPDDRAAPKVAQRYCKEHGLAALNEIVGLLVDSDGEE